MTTDCKTGVATAGRSTEQEASSKQISKADPEQPPGPTVPNGAAPNNETKVWIATEPPTTWTVIYVGQHHENQGIRLDVPSTTAAVRHNTRRGNLDARDNFLR